MKRRTFLKIFGIGVVASASGQVGAVEFEQELPITKPNNISYVDGMEIKFNPEKSNTGLSTRNVNNYGAQEIVQAGESEGGFLVPQEIADQMTGQLKNISAFRTAKVKL